MLPLNPVQPFTCCSDKHTLGRSRGVLTLDCSGMYSQSVTGSKSPFSKNFTSSASQPVYARPLALPRSAVAGKAVPNMHLKDEFIDAQRDDFGGAAFCPRRA